MKSALSLPGAKNLLSAGTLAALLLSAPITALHAEDPAATPAPASAATTESGEVKVSVKEERALLKAERKKLQAERDRLIEALKTASEEDKPKIQKALNATKALIAAVTDRITALKSEKPGEEETASEKLAEGAETVKEEGKQGALAAGEAAAGMGEVALDKTSEALGALAGQLAPEHQDTLRAAQGELAEGAAELAESKEEMREAKEELGGDVPLTAGPAESLEKARTDFDSAMEDLPDSVKTE